MNLRSQASSKPLHSVALLGATGSIGCATLDVLRCLGEPWKLHSASAHSKMDDLAKLAREFSPQHVVMTGTEHNGFPAVGSTIEGAKFAAGPEALVELATDPAVGTVVAAIVGAAGLPSTLAAAQAGKRIALANKETLVVAGELVTAAVKQSGGEIIPVDSEHSAIFQSIFSGASQQVAKVILTASGGPFRTWTKDRISEASVDDALAHPTWRMGRKITIDSATMMNKALEIIEAKWLFGLTADQIEVVVHPQSIVHSMVEFVDGSVIAQLSPPDMRLPIQYALTYPDRFDCPSPKMNWQNACQLEFVPADVERFPALELGWEVVRRGGTSGSVVNAANEAAVHLFLAGEIRFPDIVTGCRRVLEEHHFEPNPTLETLMKLDRWAREEIHKWAALC